MKEGEKERKRKKELKVFNNNRVSLSPMQTQQVAQLSQTDRATVVCCAYVRKVYCAVVGSCYASCRNCTKRDLFMSQSWRFTKQVHHFRQIFHNEGGVAYQPLLE